MSIQFPDSPTQGDSFVATNGVSYTYDNGGWIANSQSALDDRFVDLDGDTMTGDLTVPNLESAGDIQSTSQNGGQLAGFRNVIQNGSMRISQRDTSFSFASASGYQSKYTLDRWLVEWQKDVVATVEQDTKAIAAAPADYTQALRTIITDGGGQTASVFKISQRIENVNTLAGKQVTLSFVARSPNALKVGVEIYQNYGSGGGQQYEIIKELVQTDSSYTKYTVTGTLPFPPSNASGSYLCVAFWLSAGSTNASKASNVGFQSGEIDISNVQLEPGPVATPFELRPIGAELSLVQRYYYQVNTVSGGKSGQPTIPGISLATKDTTNFLTLPGLDRMRTSGMRTLATVAFYGPLLNAQKGASPSNDNEWACWYNGQGSGYKQSTNTWKLGSDNNAIYGIYVSQPASVTSLMVGKTVGQKVISLDAEL